MARILAADIGGTNMRFTLLDGEAEKKHAVFSTKAYAAGGIVQAVADFLGAEADPDVFCLACAGVVRDGRYHGHNMPFSVDATSIAKKTGIRHVALANDLEAAAHGLDRLKPEQEEIVRNGTKIAGAPVLLLAVGTGVGGALRITVGDRLHVLPCEPGQAGYAPPTEKHARVMNEAMRELGRAPIVEEIISGPGLLRIYRSLAAAANVVSPLGDVAAVSDAALRGDDPVALEAMTMLVQGIGFVIRNFASETGALGGIILAGGVAEKIAPALAWRALDFGLETANGDKLIPKPHITLVRSDRLGLDGAVALARRILAEKSA